MKSRMASVFLTVFLSLPAYAADVTVAVASNFLSTAEQLVEAYENRSGDGIILTHGSTGQIYAQLRSGAPFDIFLSADALRPELLLEEGIATETRTYAKGRLVLVSRDPVAPETIAGQFEGQAVALADPTVAPYGLAATSAMERLNLDTATFQPVLVANVGQASTIFLTGNADFAFVAASLLPRLDEAEVFELDGLHPPIQQVAARMIPPGQRPEVDAFWSYLFGEEALAIISRSGYDLP